MKRCRGAGAGRGFTLIEILVIVVIMALVAAGALIAVGTVGRDRELERESERLVALLNYAREKAELQTRELGLYCAEDGYEFLGFDPRKEQWVSIEEDDALRARELPRGLALRLIVEGRPVVLRRPPGASELAPHVMIFSNGDLTSFELTLERPDTRAAAVLEVNEQGQIALQDAAERRP